MSETITQQDIIVSLGDNKLMSSISGYRRLIRFYHDCSKYNDVTITIDFSELEWFDANLSAVLFSMIFILNKKNGLTFSIDMQLIEDKFDILMRNGFLDERIVIGKSDKSCVKLQAFDITDDVNFLKYVNDDLFANAGLNFMTPEVKNRMITNLLEVFANVNHARTNHPIFACGQFYPTLKRLKFTVVDLGVGFLLPIKEYTNGEVEEPKHAIKWALKEGATTKINVPGGFGLSDIFNFCKDTKSHLNIMTDGLLWGTNQGMIEFYEVDKLDGTIITLDFNCN